MTSLLRPLAPHPPPVECAPSSPCPWHRQRASPLRQRASSAACGHTLLHTRALRFDTLTLPAPALPTTLPCHMERGCIRVTTRPAVHVAVVIHGRALRDLRLDMDLSAHSRGRERLSYSDDRVDPVWSRHGFAATVEPALLLVARCDQGEGTWTNRSGASAVSWPLGSRTTTTTTATSWRRVCAALPAIDLWDLPLSADQTEGRPFHGGRSRRSLLILA